MASSAELEDPKLKNQLAHMGCCSFVGGVNAERIGALGGGSVFRGWIADSLLWKAYEVFHFPQMVGITSPRLRFVPSENRISVPGCRGHAALPRTPSGAMRTLPFERRRL